ncbi:MAG: adenylate kinase [Prevotellaceae bacterium]|nr:adenylate kinase [Candidatus Faecinaster equi]
MINLVIFGAPGSGKGTQSDKIVEKYGFKHISTGDVLRGEIKNGTELGKTAKSYIDKGQLIPDSLMIDILASVYDSLCPCEGVIFDGFPRTIPQAESLAKLLKERNTEVSAMIDLEVPNEVLIDRLIKRGQISGRADDNEETIKNRLAVYNNQTSPLIEWYKTAGKYNKVTGIGEIDSIFADVCKVIDNI